MDRRLVEGHAARTVKSFLRGLPVFLGVLFLYAPLLLSLARGLDGEILSQLLEAGYLGVLGRTTVQALLSTLVAAALGLPAAYIVSYTSFRGRRVLSALSLLPFVLPAMLMVLGFVLVWGNNGMINRLREVLLPGTAPISFLYRMAAIVVIHGIYNFGVFVRILSASWRSRGPEQLDAAQTLGAGPWRRFWSVVLPQSVRPLVVSSLLVFLFCFTSFGVVMVAGGGPAHATLEVSLYYLLKGTVNEDLARGVALLQLGVTLFAAIFALRAGSDRIASYSSGTPTPLVQRTSPTRFARLLCGAYYVLLCTILVLPLASVAIFAWGGDLLPGSFARQPAGVSFGAAIFASVTTGLGAAALSVALALTALALLQRKRSTLSSVFALCTLLPLCVSPLMISMSYRELFRRFGMGNKSLVSVLFVHAVIALPVVSAVIANSLRAVNARLGEAARVLGASYARRFFTVLLPLSLGGVAVAAVFALVLSLGELNAALLLTPSHAPTIPVAIYQLLGRYRTHQAAQFGVLLLVITGLSVYALDLLFRRVGRRRV